MTLDYFKVQISFQVQACSIKKDGGNASTAAACADGGDVGGVALSPPPTWNSILGLCWNSILGLFWSGFAVSSSCSYELKPSYIIL